MGPPYSRLCWACAEFAGAPVARLELETRPVEHPGQCLVRRELAGHGLGCLAAGEIARGHHDRTGLRAECHQCLRERLSLDVEMLRRLVGVHRDGRGDHQQRQAKQRRRATGKIPIPSGHRCFALPVAHAFHAPRYDVRDRPIDTFRSLHQLELLDVRAVALEVVNEHGARKVGVIAEAVLAIQVGVVACELDFVSDTLGRTVVMVDRGPE